MFLRYIGRLPQSSLVFVTHTSSNTRYDLVACDRQSASTRRGLMVSAHLFAVSYPLRWPGNGDADFQFRGRRRHAQPLAIAHVVVVGSAGNRGVPDPSKTSTREL